MFSRRRAEDHGLLRHEPDVRAYLFRVCPRDVHAVDEDATRPGSKKRSSSWNIVLLPAPEGPTNATGSPGEMSSQKSSSARVSGRDG